MSVRLWSRPDVDELLAQCWCESFYLLVPGTVIRRGHTRSCGRRTCRPPKEDRRG